MFNSPKALETLIHEKYYLTDTVSLLCVRKCSDYVIRREITTILKIATDSITLELCACVTTLLASYSWRQLNKFNCDFEDRKFPAKQAIDSTNMTATTIVKKTNLIINK